MDEKEKFNPYSIEPRKRFILKIMSYWFEDMIRKRNNPNRGKEEFNIGIKIKPSRGYPKYNTNENKEQ